MNSTTLDSSDIVDPVDIDHDYDLVGCPGLSDIDLPLSAINQGGMRPNDFLHSVQEPTTYRRSWILFLQKQQELNQSER